MATMVDNGDGYKQTNTLKGEGGKRNYTQLYETNFNLCNIFFFSRYDQKLKSVKSVKRQFFERGKDIPS